MIDKNLVGRIGWSLPLATIILTTTIHLVTGNYRAFPFFISEADYPGLERIVFKVGFSVAGIVLIYVSWLLFTTCKDRSRWYWILFLSHHRSDCRSKSNHDGNLGYLQV